MTRNHIWEWGGGGEVGYQITEHQDTVVSQTTVLLNLEWAFQFNFF